MDGNGPGITAVREWSFEGYRVPADLMQVTALK